MIINILMEVLSTMNTENEVRIVPELSHLKLQVYKDVSKKKSFKHVFYEMPRVCKKPEFGLFMIMTLVLSLLETFYIKASLNIGFCVYVLGQSNSLKTTLSHYFTKYLDRYNFRSVLASLKADTAAALDYKMSLFPDFPLVIDDYFPGIDINESNSIKQKMSLVIRKSGERMKSGRMTGNMKMQPELPARGIYIITAEDRLHGESNLARMLTVELEQGDVDWETFKFNMKQLLMLPTFVLHFRNYIAEKGSKLPELLRGSFEALRSKYTAKYDVSYARMSEIYAYMLSAFIIVLEYGISIQAIDEQQSISLFNKAEMAIITAIEKQLVAISAYSPINMFCNILTEGIVLNRLKIENLNELEDKTTDSQANRTIDGWEDDKYYYFTPNRLYSFIQHECMSQKINFPLSKEELFKRLASDKIGLIKIESNNQKGAVSYRYDVKKTIYKGYRPRLICINKNKLDLFKDEKEE